MSDATAVWIRGQIESARATTPSAAASACVRLIDAAATLRGTVMGSVFGLTTRGSDVTGSAELAAECLALVDVLAPRMSDDERAAIEKVLVSRGFRAAPVVTPWGVAEVILAAEIQDYEESEPVTDHAALARWNGAREEREELLTDVLGFDWILSSTCRLRVTDRVEAVMTFSVSREPTAAELTELRKRVDAVLFQSWGLNTEFEPPDVDDDLPHAATLKATTDARAIQAVT